VRFFDEERTEHGGLRQHGVGGFAQDGGALGYNHRAPLLIAAPARFISANDVFDIKLWHHRHHNAQGRQQRLAHGGHGQIEAGAVLAGTGVHSEQVGRQRQAGVWLQAQGRDQQLLHTHRFMGHLVHKGRVGAVFQQATHQVGQQVAVGAHGRAYKRQLTSGFFCTSR
jgi:hypothetical protein